CPGFDAGASDVNGSFHPAPRAGGSDLAGLLEPAEGAARRVPVDLRSVSENGSAQSPAFDARLASRFDAAGAGTTAEARRTGAVGRMSSSSSTAWRLAATCLPPLRDG